MRTTHDTDYDRSSRAISRPTRIAVLTTVLLACTFAATVTDGTSAAAQPLQPQGRPCFEVWGVDGLPIWYLCSGIYRNDVHDLERDAKATADHSRTDQQSIIRWMYWPSHPGFQNETSTSITRWIASPIQIGFTHPAATQ